MGIAASKAFGQWEAKVVGVSRGFDFLAMKLNATPQFIDQLRSATSNLVDDMQLMKQVNNAIILVDYVNILRARGLNRNEAIVTAGATRLRPVLLTATPSTTGPSTRT